MSTAGAARSRSSTPRFAWLGRARRRARHAYATLDPRSVGVFRIVLGFLLVADGLRHWSAIGFLYCNDGVLTNDFHLWQPSSGWMWSLFHAFSTRSEVHVAFAGMIACHLAVMVGWRPRLFALLSFVAVTSRDARITMVENGGYIVVNLICLYAAFLPLGERFSVDAFVASWRRRRERAPSELADRAPIRGSTAPFVSLVAALILANLALVYFGNVVNKSGNLWRAGTAVHYVLHLDRMVTGLAVFCREHLPDALIRVADWSTLTTEATILATIACPFGLRFTRPTAVVLMILIHGTFGIMMRLGPFSWFLIGWSMLLPRAATWDDLGAWFRHRTRAVEIGVVPGSRVAMTIARFLARIDVLERMRFTEGAPGSRLLTVRVDGASNDDPAHVAAAIASALPLGGVVYALLRVATLGAPARALAFADRHQARLERFFGLDRESPASTPPSPARLRTRVWTGRAREVFAVYMAIGFTWQAVLEAKGLPKRFKPEQPKVFAMPINTFRVYQGWGMFAANPIQEDGILVIDAYTIDGRRVDPYNGGIPDLDLTDSRGLAIDQLHQDYGNRIRLDGNAHYRDQLKEHLFKYHLATGNPADELVAFDVYWLRDRCPKPGSNKPYDNDPVAIATWRKSGYVAPTGGIKIPPPPKIRSAEKWDEPDQKPGPAP